MSTSKYLQAKRNTQRNIACLETLYDKNVEDHLSVAPLLELLRSAYGIRNIHLSCNTLGEFEYNLSLLHRKPSFRILYLAGHGSRGTIKFNDGSALDLEQLADCLGDRFNGWGIHFGSCSVLRVAQHRWDEFKVRTGVSFVSGYTRNVDWMESAALDLLWLSSTQVRSLDEAAASLRKRHPDLVANTGFDVR